MSHLFTKSFAALALAAGSLGTAHSAAIASVTYFLNANCIDCAQVAEAESFAVQAEIKLNGFVPLGSEISAENFLSFVYRGSNLLDAFSVTVSGDDLDETTTDYTLGTVMGMLPSTLPGAFSLYITLESEGFQFLDFDADGSWRICITGCVDGALLDNDFGNNAVLSNTPGATVPEPGSLALTGLALLGLGAARRARRR